MNIFRKKIASKVTENPIFSISSQTDTKPHKRKLKINFSTLMIYLSAFLLLLAIVIVGYYESEKGNESSEANVTSISSTVDDVVAANLASVVASSSDLAVATSVSNLAISTQAENEYKSIISSTSASKPQIIEAGVINRSLITYIVQDGDTIDSIASKFSISTQTIKWANNMTSSTVTVGSSLKILPINGIIYTVKSGDTVQSIAKKYQADQTRIIVYNDLDVSGLEIGHSIIIPDGILPEDERPGYVSAYTYAGTSSGFGGTTWFISYGSGNCGPYAYGNCTCYAYYRRLELSLPVGNHWGNASSWAYYARSEGYTVNSTPSAGAIIQNGGGYGHVGIVESVLANGDISISEMNAYVTGGGFNIVSGRIVPASSVGNYLYIH